MVEFTEPVLLALESRRHSATAVAKRHRYQDLLRAEPGDRILDVGCGSGGFCRALAPLVAPDGRVVGVDCSPAAVDLATRLSAAEDPSLLEFTCADAEALPFADGSFDAAVCISVLEFCQRPDRALAEMRRVMRPGGRVLVANSDEDTRVYNGRDRELGRRLARAIADRGRDPWLGRRLAPLLTAAGFRLEQETVLVDLEREYAPGTSGYTLAHLLRDYLVSEAGVPAPEYARWLEDLDACARDGTYCYSVVTYACLAVR
jgi:SAM-dependent methyltransferase